VPLWARAPQLHAYLIPAAALFAALCWLNCTAIDFWEHEDQKDPALSLRHQKIIPRGAALIASASLALIALTCAAKLSPWPALQLLFLQPLIWTASACTLSALLLLALHLSRRRISRLHLRVAADAVLLTPLLCLPFLH
jgi:hypothetical protein